jgi:hypothetical protein
VPHVPVVHVPPHPSLAPHARPAHDGVHAPLPHRFAPFAPHTRPAGQLPQSMLVPQRPTMLPQYPAQSAALFGVQRAPSAPTVPSLEPSVTPPSVSPGMST